MLSSCAGRRISASSAECEGRGAGSGCRPRRRRRPSTSSRAGRGHGFTGHNSRRPATVRLRGAASGRDMSRPRITSMPRTTPRPHGRVATAKRHDSIKGHASASVVALALLCSASWSSSAVRGCTPPGSRSCAADTSRAGLRPSQPGTGMATGASSAATSGSPWRTSRGGAIFTGRARVPSDRPPDRPPTHDTVRRYCRATRATREPGIDRRLIRVAHGRRLEASTVADGAHEPGRDGHVRSRRHRPQRAPGVPGGTGRPQLPTRSRPRAYSRWRSVSRPGVYDQRSETGGAIRLRQTSPRLHAREAEVPPRRGQRQLRGTQVARAATSALGHARGR